MKRLMTTTTVVVAISLAAGAAFAQQQPMTGPVATYWVTAQTASGFPGLGAGGGAGFNPMAMMSGGGVTRSLLLQLQAERTATAPTAEHVPPAALAMGQSLPLLTPRGASASVSDPGEVKPSDLDQATRGRLPRILVYHGCGDATRSGQPVEIRMSGANMDAMRALANNIQVTPARGPSPGEGRTYGDWPNQRTRTAVPANASLVGDHLVRGNYTPDIRFSLNQNQDFLAPLQLTGIGTPGSNQLGWGAIPNAEGYFAMAMGTNAGGDMVMWTSSEVAIMPSGLPDILTPADLERLQGRKIILPASATQCAIPRAVVQAAPEAMVKVTAFGGEANFSYPERPADRRQPWNIEYAVKVRYASTASVILGMEAPGAEVGAEGEAAAATNPARGPQIPGGAVGSAVARGLIGGILGRR